MYQAQRRNLEQLLERKWAEVSKLSELHKQELNRKLRPTTKQENVSDELLKKLINNCFHDLEAS